MYLFSLVSWLLRKERKIEKKKTFVNCSFLLYTEPDVIRNLNVSTITTSSVFLTWVEPAGNRSFFKLQWTVEKNNANATETSNTSYNITGLNAGVNYTFCITAVAADQSTQGGTVCISQFTSMQTYKVHVLYYKAHLNYLTIMGSCSMKGNSCSIDLQ